MDTALQQILKQEGGQLVMDDDSDADDLSSDESSI
jgi:hypothetical protein